MATKWFTGKVIGLEQLSPSTKQFTLEVKGEPIFSFLPGQFVTFDLPISEKRLHRWRSYSVASHPNQSNSIELCIVKSDDGLGTKYLFDDVVVGSELVFKGPDGGFTLHKDLSDEIVMICTGTGVAPFRSMIKHVFAQDLDFKKIHLIFGTRKKEDILYFDEFDRLAKTDPKFKYHTALSRENIDGFHHGYIHDIYMEQYKDVIPSRHFYICGWSNMIDDAVANLLLKLGYDRSQIHYELYG
jgi:CDP-4-dehydro-6-deoxyglucose reductase